jgi:hypothetical protein
MPNNFAESPNESARRSKIKRKSRNKGKALHLHQRADDSHISQNGSGLIASPVDASDVTSHPLVARVKWETEKPKNGSIANWDNDFHDVSELRGHLLDLASGTLPKIDIGVVAGQVHQQRPQQTSAEESHTARSIASSIPSIALEDDFEDVQIATDMHNLPRILGIEQEKREASMPPISDIAAERLMESEDPRILKHDAGKPVDKEESVSRNGSIRASSSHQKDVITQEQQHYPLLKHDGLSVEMPPFGRNCTSDVISSPYSSVQYSALGGRKGFCDVSDVAGDNDSSPAPSDGEMESNFMKDDEFLEDSRNSSIGNSSSSMEKNRRSSPAESEVSRNTPPSVSKGDSSTYDKNSQLTSQASFPPLLKRTDSDARATTSADASAAADGSFEENVDSILPKLAASVVTNESS